MALYACPDCSREVSDAATICPGCGRPLSTELAADLIARKQSSHAEGAKLVGLSTKLTLLGFVLAAAGCGAAPVLKTPMTIWVGFGLGFPVLVLAAVIGQIGRAKQGRVV